MKDSMSTHTSMPAITLSVILLSLTMIPTVCSADSPTLWQIGEFNDSSLEFHQGAPQQDPVFVVGQSDPAKDWYAAQWCTSVGGRAHPFTVRFDLPQAPSGLYTLKLSLLAHAIRLPVLEVSMNGHRGRFFQHPVLNYTGNDPADRFIPIFSKVSIAFDVPTRFLQQGANTLVLTAVDEPVGSHSEITYSALAVGGPPQITYDALALERNPAKTYSAEAITAEVLPTIFYKSRSNGLVELVDVFLRYGEPPQRGRVTLALGSNQLAQEMAAGTEFGEQRLRFEVPEFSPPTPAQVTVAMNGRTRHVPAKVNPGKKWNLFVVPHQHLDIGFTDYPPKVAEVQSRAIDEAIDMIREHPDFRYTLDAGWVAEQFMAGRSDAQRKEFLRLIREKKIFVPADYSPAFTGFYSTEGHLRAFYPSYKFNRENGGDFDQSILTDLPSHSWSYPSLMASAGLKYLVLPSNQDLGPILLRGNPHLNEKTPFWWEGPDGQRILTWYSRHYHQLQTLFGLPPRVEAGHDTLPTFLQMYTRPDYKSDGAMIFGSQVENTDLYREQAALAGQWNQTYAFPKLKYSGVTEAMSYIAQQLGDSIPVLRGDGGPYWDIFTAGAPMVMERETEHRMLAAEKFSTISSLVNPRIWPDRRGLEEAWRGILTFQEHTGGAGGRSGTLRGRYGNDVLGTYNARVAEGVLARGMSALADAIPVPTRTLVVFNPLNWQRSKLVEFNLSRNLEVVDHATKQVVSIEVLPTPPVYFGGANRGPTRRVRFMATDIPAVGYKCYTLRPTANEAQAPAAGAGTTMESVYYRVELDPSSGAVRSIFDKDLNRELVDTSSPYRFDQYVLATGEQDRFSGSGLSTAVVPAPKLDIQVPKDGRLASVTKTPFGMVARLQSSAAITPGIATEIILYDGQKKIEFVNHVRHTSGPRGVWRYFAFPFAMNRPEFRYEIQNGVVNPAKDVLPGSGKEWFPVQHWAAVEQDGITAAIVPVDESLMTFGDIIRYRWPSEFGTRKGTLFSYYARGIDQELTLRYVVTSGRALTPETLSKLGWEAMAPLELNEVAAEDKVGNSPRPLDPAQASFLQTDHPGVVLLTWKRAEDEKGTIMRFVDTTGQLGKVHISTSLLSLERGWLCNTVEENQRPLTVSARGFSFDVKPFEIVTVRLEGTPLVKQE